MTATIRTRNEYCSRVSASIAAFLLACYFGRASVLERAGVLDSDFILATASYAALAISVIWQFFDGRLQFRLVALPVLGATFISVLCSQNRQHSMTMWAGWVLLLGAVGPVFATPRASRLRASTYKYAKSLVIVAVILSCIWLLSGAPSLGRGDFSGVMCHSLTLGPICAIGGALAFTYYLSGGTAWWLVLLGASGLLTLASASRASLAALAAALVVVFAARIMKDPVVTFLTVFAVAPLPLLIEPAIDLATQVLPSQYVEGFIRKGLIHTREQHWQSRWEEFEARPLVGIGFCWGTEGTAGFNDETLRIETGSSYVAIMSMTGIIGAIGLSSVIAQIAYLLASKWRYIPVALRLEIIALATFWSVHLGAEGYIFATGSVFTVCFWLWCAWAIDSLSGARLHFDSDQRMANQHVKGLR